MGPKSRWAQKRDVRSARFGLLAVHAKQRGLGGHLGVRGRGGLGAFPLGPRRIPDKGLSQGYGRCRLVLFGDRDVDVHSPSAMKSLRSGLHRLFWSVVFLGQVGKEDVLQARGDSGCLPEESRSLDVGKMAVVATNTLLQAPRVVALEQHVDVVVELEDGDIEARHLLHQQAGRGAKVGDHPDAGIAARNRKTNGVDGVVGNGDRFDSEPAQGPRGAGFDERKAIRPATFGDALGGSRSGEKLGSFAALSAKLALKYSGGGDVVGVFVGQKDPLDRSSFQT